MCATALLAEKMFGRLVLQNIANFLFVRRNITNFCWIEVVEKFWTFLNCFFKKENKYLNKLLGLLKKIALIYRILRKF